MSKKVSAQLGADSELWGPRPVKWGLRMFELQGRALATSLSLPDVCAIAAFLGLILPESFRGDEAPDLLMLALKRRSAPEKINQVRVPPLWRNLRHLKRSFGLNATDLDLIALRAMLRLNSGFKALVEKYLGDRTDFLYHRQLAAVLGVPSQKVESALDPDGRLVQSGLVSVNTGGSGALEDRLRLAPGLISNLVKPCKSAEELMASLLPRKRKPHLSLDDYPHLRDEIRLLCDSLQQALTARCSGMNILLHGRPGTGKSELAAALAAALSCPLYEVPGGYGKSWTPRDRLGAVMHMQRITPVAGKGILLVDESEDMFPTSSSDSERVPTKATINQCLEHNPTPTIWITNRVGHLDEAFLRRFNLVIHVPQLPVSAKCELLRKALPSGSLDDCEIRRFADQRELPPAMLTRLAEVAVAGGAKGNADVRRNLHVLLKHYIKALGAAPPCFASQTPTLKHDLRLVNTDIPLEPILEAMVSSTAGARILLHGVPGTGKTAFGRAMAERLDRPLLQKQASALLSMWVGGTERNLREMFDEARQEDSVLLLDEVDSFLRNRSGAGARWEATQTNELLTQMEVFEGIFICTTNRPDDLDPAALRRFDLKVEFRPLRKNQRLELVRQCCSALEIEFDPCDAAMDSSLRQLDGLTPGDAATALRHLAISGEPPTRRLLLEALETELRYKPKACRPVGFIH